MKAHLSKKMIEVFCVIFIAICSVILASPRYTSQLLRRPPDHIFIGMSTYFEDFYYYLDQFYQGAHGSWLTENRFSIERFPPTIIYFSHIILGKIGGMLGWESFQSFNYFGLLFKFLFMLVSYVFISQFTGKSFFKRILTFLIFLYSTSLPNFVIKNGSLILASSIDVFRTENRILARFGTSPNGMLINFLFVLLLLRLGYLFKKEYEIGQTATNTQGVRSVIHTKDIVFITILFSIITVSDAFKSLIMFLIYITLFMVLRIKLFTRLVMPEFKYLLVVLSTLFIIISGLLLNVISNDPVYKQANNWDIVQYLAQIRAIGLANFIKGFGLQLPFFLYGLFLLLRKHNKTIYEYLVIIIVIYCWGGYLIPLFLQIPIPGFRFIFPATYICMSYMVMISFMDISEKFRSKKLLTCLIIVYFAVNLTNFIRGWSDEIKPLQEPDYHFAYIPNELYEGFKFLQTAEPLDGNVLSSPETSIDLMIPGLSGRYTYSGHFLTTYNVVQKDQNARKFFKEWTDRPGTHEFLKQNNIKFIVVTKYSGVLSDFKKYYPFLKVVFENPTVTIFRYDS
jgi:hypothetical protein